MRDGLGFRAEGVGFRGSGVWGVLGGFRARCEVLQGLKKGSGYSGLEC